MWDEVIMRKKKANDEKALGLTHLQARINDATMKKDSLKIKQILKELESDYANQPDFYYIRAYLYFQIEQYEAATKYADLSIQAKSHDEAEAYRLLGLAKRKLFVHREAIAALETSNRIVFAKKDIPSSSDFIGCNLLMLGQLYLTVGDVEHAKEAYLEACRYNTEIKEQQQAYSSYLMCLHYDKKLTPNEIFDEHCQYNQFFSENLQPLIPAKRKKHKIRIGYISPDFRRHVMCFFYQAFLRNYNRNKFTVHCYCLNEEDGITQQFKSLVDEWRNVKANTVEEIAQIIYQDEVDVLVDLAGHSANNALPILQYRPALVQISGLGYFNTTGLHTVDYFFTDRFIDPIGQHDALFTEKLLRLTHSQFCYKPWDDVGEVQAAPCLKNEYVTFGCFNKYAKITDEAIAVWSKILYRVPKAKLILKSLAYIDTGIRQELSKRLLSYGISQERFELRPATSNYMEEYNEIDIALDTFPYPGGGTTCDALYMGVPVIAMVGQRHGSRFGYSILCNVGLKELTAQDKPEYIEKAIGLASDQELIAILHANLRRMMRKSPLMDANAYMQEVESYYEAALKEKWNDIVLQKQVKYKK